jgi:hypothetical protein
MTIDHERCSELLGSFVLRELAPDEAQAVEAHLATCEECELERRGLAALTAEPEEDPVLTEFERAALHRTLAAARSAPGTEVMPARRSIWARVAPALGAAALIVFAVFGLTRIEFGGEDQDDAATEGGGGATVEELRAEDVEVEVGGPDIADAPAPAALNAAAQDATETQRANAEEEQADGSAGFSGAARGFAARFDPDAGQFTARQLRRYAARQPPFVQASSEYQVRDADEPLGHSHLLALAGAASAERESETIRRCGEQVLEQDLPLLPVYGGFGRLGGRDVLVIGFVFGRDVALDRFLVWVWPQRSCDIPVLVQDGRLRAP